MAEYGVENYKELVTLGARGSIAFHLVTSDGFQMGDINAIIGAVTAIPAAVKDIDMIDDEIADMDEQERLEIENHTELLLSEMGFVTDNVRQAVLDFGNGGLYIARGVLNLQKKED